MEKKITAKIIVRILIFILCMVIIKGFEIILNVKLFILYEILAQLSLIYIMFAIFSNKFQRIIVVFYIFLDGLILKKFFFLSKEYFISLSLITLLTYFLLIHNDNKVNKINLLILPILILIVHYLCAAVYIYLHLYNFMKIFG